MTPVDSTRARLSVADARTALVGVLAVVFYRTGWLVFTVVRFALLAAGAPLWGAGWLARRALWPAAKWCGAAVALGWADGQRREEGQRR